MDRVECRNEECDYWAPGYVAAIEANREYIGFELDEQGAYKPIIERRIGEAKRQRQASVNAEADDD